MRPMRTSRELLAVFDGQILKDNATGKSLVEVCLSLVCYIHNYHVTITNSRLENEIVPFSCDIINCVHLKKTQTAQMTHP